MKIKYLIALLASTTIPIFTLAETAGATVYEKSGVQIGEETFNVRYIEYEPPLLFRMMKPEKGTQPEWAKTEEMMGEFYKYEYSAVTNCFTSESLKFNGMTPEYFEKMKQDRLNNKAVPHIGLAESLLVSEVYLKNSKREYLMVTMRHQKWIKPDGTELNADAPTRMLFVKKNGMWKSDTTPTADEKWGEHIPKTKQAILEWIK